MDKQFDTSNPIELVAALSAGALHIATDDSGRSSVEVEGPRAEEFTVELRGRQLHVLAPRGRGSLSRHTDGHQVRVTVPAGSDLTTRTGSADVEATGRYGRVRAKTGSGALALERADGDVDLVAGSGQLRCGTAAGSVRARTGSGDVEVGAVHGELAVSTGSGDVTIGTAAAATLLKTGSGSTAVTHSEGDLSVVTGSGSLRVGRAEPGRIRARAGSGDLCVGVPAGTPVWTDLHTGSGRIGSELAPVGKPAEGQDHLELRLTTGSGDILLSQV